MSSIAQTQLTGEKRESFQFLLKITSVRDKGERVDHLDRGNIYYFIVWIGSLIREGSIVLKLGFSSEWRWLAQRHQVMLTGMWFLGTRSDWCNLRSLLVIVWRIPSLRYVNSIHPSSLGLNNKPRYSSPKVILGI